LGLSFTICGHNAVAARGMNNVLTWPPSISGRQDLRILVGATSRDTQAQDCKLDGPIKGLLRHSRLTPLTPLFPTNMPGITTRTQSAFTCKSSPHKYLSVPDRGPRQPISKYGTQNPLLSPSSLSIVQPLALIQTANSSKPHIHNKSNVPHNYHYLFLRLWNGVSKFFDTHMW
jgi:hypothetical protein